MSLTLANGSVDSEAVEEIAMDFSNAAGNASPLIKNGEYGSLNSMIPPGSASPKLPPPERKQRDPKIIEHIDACRRDSSLCPVQFQEVELNKEQSCIPNDSYAGRCVEIVPMALASNRDKFKEKCGVYWGCGDSCDKEGTDYAKTCIHGWQEEGSCESPKNCNVSELEIIQMSVKQRMIIEDTCGVTWPCHETVY